MRQCTQIAAQFTDCSVLKLWSVCNLSIFEVVKMLLATTSMFACVPVACRCPGAVTPGRWQANTTGSAAAGARGRAARTWHLPSRENGTAPTRGVLCLDYRIFFLPHCCWTSRVSFCESCCRVTACKEFLKCFNLF